MADATVPFWYVHELGDVPPGCRYELAIVRGKHWYKVFPAGTEPAADEDTSKHKVRDVVAEANLDTAQQAARKES